MKISKRMKWAGIVIAGTGILAVIAIVAFAAFMIYVGSDALSSGATGSELLRPDGTAAGKALVVYNPGLSGAPKNAAAQIADDLKARGYEVMLAGVNSTAAANVSGYDVIVAGGPIYGGKVSPSIDAYLRELVPPDNAKVGAFAIGGSTGEAFPDAAWLKTTRLFPQGSGIDERAGFVAELLE